jgi:DNA (cytosine-5)-methyltransferase 1
VELNMKKINAISMFSGAGIGEYYLEKCGIKVVAASELINSRSKLYQWFYPETKIFGDITNEDSFNGLLSSAKKENCKLLIATPPCQGMSSLGKKDYDQDQRNYLVFYVIRLMKEHDFDYIFIENVPKFIKLYFPYENDLKTLEYILNEEFGDFYLVEIDVLNAQDYGIPQSRPRSIIRIYKKYLLWPLPIKEPIISLKDAIGDLPTLESGETSIYKWHYAKLHNPREILAMRHTPEGNSAMRNDIYYPRKVNGDRIKGFHNTYKRMKWDTPSPARAMNNGNMGGHNNVHPGRKLKDGTYSDARVLTLRELFIVTSLPSDIDLPDWASDNLIRQVVGEGVPPRLSQKLLCNLYKNDFDKK